MASRFFLSLFMFGAHVHAQSYAPNTSVQCPNGWLVEPADGLPQREEAYRTSRKAIADANLATWLENTNSGFEPDNCDLPTIALTSSGGGIRALLSGAGVIQAFDSRDSDSGTSGLFQALTYQAGLSGGGWLISSFAGNKYPTISWLKDNLWNQSLTDPIGLGTDNLADIISDVHGKEKRGFNTGIPDYWGRFLSYSLLRGEDAGVADTLSSLTSLSNFTSYEVPYPIITSLGVKTFEGAETPLDNATTWEFTPFTFGSWDAEVSAFTQTAYLGTSLNNGIPQDQCVTNFDNLGFVLGTSSNLANLASSLIDEVSKILTFVTDPSEFASYPNPFYNYISSTSSPTLDPSNNISAQQTLSLVDGGESWQNNPIFPLLQPSRNISVIVVNDNSADTLTNWPDGSELQRTYNQSLIRNLTRMPPIPLNTIFESQGLNQHATFFGCNDTSKVTIIYLPMANFSFMSNYSTYTANYTSSAQAGVIANGNEIATQGGQIDWPTCLGCGLMMKTGQTLPTECTACFEKHCWDWDGALPSGRGSYMKRSHKKRHGFR